MTEFKVGDKVRATHPEDWCDTNSREGYEVVSSDGELGFYDDVHDWRVLDYFSYDELELVIESPSPDTFITETKQIDYGGVFADPNYPDIEVEVNDVGLGDIVLYQDDGGDSGVYDDIYISRDRLKAFATALLELAEALEKRDE